MTNDTDTVKVNEKLTLYRRANSKRWQARLLLQNGEWHRFSTKTTDLDAAKDFALRQFYTADFRKQNNLPESTRKLKRVAMFTINRMREELDAGGGKVVFVDYISAIDRYIIPYFGNMDVAAIKVSDLQDFDKWRTDKLGRQASHSTINTHNRCRVLQDSLVERGVITPTSHPETYEKLFELGASNFSGIGHYGSYVHMGNGSQAAWGPDTTSATLAPNFAAAINRGRG